MPPTPVEESIVRIETLGPVGPFQYIGLVIANGLVVASSVGEANPVTSAQIVAPDGTRYEATGVAGYFDSGKLLLLSVDWKGHTPPPVRFAARVTAPILAATISRGKDPSGQVEQQDIEVLETQPFGIVCATDGVALDRHWLGAPILKPGGEVVGLLASYEGRAEPGGHLAIQERLKHIGIRAESIEAISPLVNVISWNQWQLLRVEISESRSLCSSAALQLQSNSLKAALVTIDRSIEIDPFNAIAWKMKAATLQNLRRWTESIAACHRAAAINPGDAAPHCIEADAFTNLRRFDDALLEAETAIDLDSKLPVAHYVKGQALVGLGLNSDAGRAFRRALSIDPKFDPAIYALKRLDGQEPSKSH